MRLPNKSSYESRSMGVAMRSPVLEEQRKQYVAARQNFIPMPTNYDDVANAQARAAMAKGEATLAFADAFNKGSDAVIQVNKIQNEAKSAAKEAELRSWVAGYLGSAANRQMHERDGTGRYAWENERDKFEREFRQFEKELDRAYKFDNGLIANDYANKRKGILTTFNVELDGLIDNAKDDVARANLLEVARNESNLQNLESYADQFTAVYGPVEGEKLMQQARDRIFAQGVIDQIQTNPEARSNDFLDLYIEMLYDQFTEKKISPEAFKGLKADLEREKVKNTEVAKNDIRAAQTPEEFKSRLQGWIELGTLGEEDRMTWGKTALSTFIYEDVEKRLDESYQNGGNARDFLDIAMNAIANPDVNPAERRAIEDKQLQLVKSKQMDFLRKLDSGDLYTIQRTDDGNVKTPYGSKARTEIQRITEVLMGDDFDAIMNMGFNPYSINYKNDAQSYLDDLERHVTGMEDARANSERKADIRSKESMLMGAWKTDPSLMRLADDPMNNNYDLAVKNSQEIFESWAADIRTDINGSEYKEVRGYTDAQLANAFVALSGIAPEGYVASLTRTIGQNPSNARAQQEILGAYASLQELYAINNAIINQKGLEDTGIAEALEAAHFMKGAVDKFDAISRFLASKDKIANDPKEAERLQKVAEQGLTDGTLDDWWAGHRNANPALPEKISPQLMWEIKERLDVYARTTSDPRWAYERAYTDAVQNFGVERGMSIDENGELVETVRFKYMSIFSLHDHGGGFDATSQKQGEGFLESLNFSSKPSANNLVQITIEDKVGEHGIDMDTIDTMYFKDAGYPGGGYWAVVNAVTGAPELMKPGTPSYEAAMAANNGMPGNFMIIIARDELSPRAQEVKQKREDAINYENARDEWRKFTDKTSQNQSVSGAIGNTFKGPENQGNEVLGKMSYEEIEENVKPWEKIQEQATPGSVEWWEAKAMVRLMRSDIYRTALQQNNVDIVAELENEARAVARSWQSVQKEIIIPESHPSAKGGPEHLEKLRDTDYFLDGNSSEYDEASA